MNTDITKQPSIAKFLQNLNKKLKKGEKYHGKVDLARHKLSPTEFIGSIFHTGFDLLAEKDKKGHFHFTLKKIGKPGDISEIQKARKLIFKQPRMGKHGKTINVLKLRTMFPMAHKAQDYLYSRSKLGPYGKIAQDFRITRIGKFLRKYWIDELLQLINILKGEMKLVGLRPLTKGFHKSLPKQLQIKRLKHTPALMAAIYADRPQNLKERIQAELKYLKAKQKHPIRTDIIYFFRIIYSILFRGQRGY